MFVGREEELGVLAAQSAAPQGKMIIVTGRRRVGKTELLRHFAKGKPHLFFSADLSPEAEQLRQFNALLRSRHIAGLPEFQLLTSWDAVFEFLFGAFSLSPSIVILDEFPYLCQSNQALPSIIQKWWDVRGKNSNLTLILCGSSVSFMEKRLLNAESPLFGRRTGQIVLQPLRFLEARKFFTGSSWQDAVAAYAVFGGTPLYLSQRDSRISLKDNVINAVLDKHSPLFEEPKFLLMQELNEPSVYFSLLRSMASGKTRLNEIAQDAGDVGSSKANKYISILRDLRLVRREAPVTEASPERTRRGIYLIDDPFFRFWFRFVFPNRSLLEDGESQLVWKNKIAPDLDTFVGSAFEEICLQMLKEKRKKNLLPFTPEKLGRWWDGQDEIDIVGLDIEGNQLFCECKWTKKKIGLNVLRELERKSSKLLHAKSKYYCLCAKSGFSNDLLVEQKGRKDIQLISEHNFG